MWIGLKCKNTPDGLEGRHLIYTESRGTRKIPQVIKQNILCHFKNWRQFCAYTTSVNFSWLLVTTEFKLFPPKKKTTKQNKKQQYKCNRWFYVICISWACKLSSVFFLQIFLSTSHSKMFMQYSFRCWLMLL